MISIEIAILGHGRNCRIKCSVMPTINRCKVLINKLFGEEISLTLWRISPVCHNGKLSSTVWRCWRINKSTFILQLCIVFRLGWQKCAEIFNGEGLSHLKIFGFAKTKTLKLRAQYLSHITGVNYYAHLRLVERLFHLEDPSRDGKFQNGLHFKCHHYRTHIRTTSLAMKEVIRWWAIMQSFWNCLPWVRFRSDFCWERLITSYNRYKKRALTTKYGGFKFVFTGALKTFTNFVTSTADEVILTFFSSYLSTDGSKVRLQSNVVCCINNRCNYPKIKNKLV